MQPARRGRLEKISDKGLILKAFSLCVQGLHQRIVGLWPSAKSACKRDYARVQHRRATDVRAAQISQILGGKSANLSQVDVSRRTQWRGLPQHLAGTVRPLALVRVVVSATSQPCHPAAKTNATKLIGLRANGSRSKARSNVIARRLLAGILPHHGEDMELGVDRPHAARPITNKVAAPSLTPLYLAALDEASDDAFEAYTELRSQMSNRSHQIIRTLGGCSKASASRSSQRTKGRVGRGSTKLPRRHKAQALAVTSKTS